MTEAPVPFMALFYMAGALAVLWHGALRFHRPVDKSSPARSTGRRARAACWATAWRRPSASAYRAACFPTRPAWVLPSWCMLQRMPKEPCEQGMWAVFEVFFDTIVMCTVTALVILTSGVYDAAQYDAPRQYAAASQLQTGAALTAAAFSVFGPLGGGFARIAGAVRVFHPARLVHYGQRAAEPVSAAGPRYKALLHLRLLSGCTMRLDWLWALSGYVQRADGAAQSGGVFACGGSARGVAPLLNGEGF